MADTDENIQIKVNDKIDSSIASKLERIEKTATSAHSAIERLNKALASVNSSALNKLNTAANTTTTVINNTSSAVDKLAAAQDRNTSAIDRLTAATSKLSSANKVGRKETDLLAEAEKRGAAARAKLDKEAEQLRRSLNPLYAAQQQYNESVQRSLYLYKAGAISVQTYTAAVNQAAERLESSRMIMGRYNTGLNNMGKQAGLARHQVLNLSYQLQDVGVSLASGMNPLVVLAQQGSQIAGIAQQAELGIGGMTAAIGRLLLKIVPFAAAIGVAYGALKLFTSEIEKTAELDKFVKGLGLTHKELKKLEDQSITFGDTLRGLWATFDDSGRISAFFGDLWESAKKTFTNIIGIVALAANAIYAHFEAAYDVIIEIWRRFPAAFKAPIINAINEVIEAYEKMVNIAIGGINKIIEAANKVAPKKITPFDLVEFGKLDTTIVEASGKNLADIYVDSFTRNLAGNQESTSAFMQEWMANTVLAAQERLRKAADKIIADRSKGGGKLSDLEKGLKILERFNTEMEQELKLLQMLPREREVEARLMRLQNQLAEKGVSLSTTEIEQIRTKLGLIQQANIVSQQESALMDGAYYRREQYIAQLQAINNLKNNPKANFSGGDVAQAVMGINSDMDFSYTQTAIDARIVQYQEMYDRIDQMRQAEVINERTAAALQTRIWAQEQSEKLQVASDFFGQLSQLQQSENKKIAAIGKAAAITKAIIDTYQAANSAYAAMAGIPVVGPALGAAAAAAAVVAGMANVQAIRSQSTGFMAGGYTGGSSVTEERGVVHGKEYVMDAQTTKRIGVDNLDAMRSGESFSFGGEKKATVVIKPTIINNIADVATVSATTTENEDGSVDFEVMIDRIEDSLAERANRGNSDLLTAIGGGLGVSPKPRGSF